MAPVDDVRAKKAQTTLDEAEALHLIFMREEEKLARDVYLTLAEMYPGAPVFYNIATQSEQEHTDTVRDKLAQYGIADPNPDTNNLPDSIGIFTGEEFGWYFTQKYELLVSWGSESLLDALYVGAFIEELDMLDIAMCPKVIVENYEDIENPEDCGLIYTDERAITNVLSHLLDGSINHMCAYVSNIETIIGQGKYEAQIMTQAEVDELLSGC